MALNDDDKKFIKKTVDDAVDKKTTSFEKSAANEKSSRLKAQIEERKERQAYLKQLKELQTNGDATMAQKFELMKEEINSKISQDIKDTVKTTMDTVGKGANTVGRGVGKATSGVDSLITRMASINPILAALYSGTKGVTRDIWNIGAGSVQAALGGAQMAWGAGKTAVGLVGSTMNSMRNMYLKRKAKNQPQQEPEMEMETPLPVTPQEEQQEQPNLELPSLLPEQESTSESLKDMQKRIKEIHEATVKSKKEQEDGMKSQLKSLAGMQKTMTAVNDVMKILKAKQMLIVGGVLLGVAALVGLCIWFQKGGFANLLNMLKNPVDKTINDSFDNKDANQSNAYKMDAQGSALSGMTGKLQQTLFTKKPQMLTGISNTQTTKGTALDANGQSYDLTTMKFTTGELTPILAPYDGGVTTLNKQTNKSQGKIVNVRWVMTISANDPKKYPALKLRNITSPQLQPGEIFKQGDIIAYSTSDFTIENVWGWENDKMSELSNYQTMVNKADENDYKDALQRLSETKTEQKTEKLNDFMYKKDRASYNAQPHEGDKIGNAAEKIHDFFHKKDQDIERNRWETERLNQQTEFLKNFNQQQSPNQTNEFDGAKTPDAGTVTGGAAPIPETTSENEQKVQQTSEQLTQETQPKPTEEKGYVGTLPELGKTNITMETPSIFTPDKYSTQMTPFDYGLSARSQGQNTIGVGN